MLKAKMSIQDYIYGYLSEAISSRGNSKNEGRLEIGDMKTYDDIERRLSTSTFYTLLLSFNDEYLVAIDREKPLGLPKHANFTGVWMYRDESEVTGNNRLFIFNSLHTYFVLDFDKDGYLCNVQKIWTTNGKPLTAGGTEKFLKELRIELDK